VGQHLTLNHAGYFRNYVAAATDQIELVLFADLRDDAGNIFLPGSLMAQHFLLSAAARSLSPAKVMRMSDRGAENVFLRLRWPQTDGKPVCRTAAASFVTTVGARTASHAGDAKRVARISR
jgi:hypothetical protein